MSFRLFYGFGLGLAVLIIQMVVTGIFFDQDLHFYTRGALNPDPQHPPGYAVYLSICYKILPYAWLPVSLQLLFYAVSSLLLADILFKSNIFFYLGILILSVSPIVIFFLKSLLSESLFLALFYLTLFFLIKKEYLSTGLLIGLMFLFRYTALFFIPIILILFIKDKNFNNLICLIIPIKIIFISIIILNGVRLNGWQLTTTGLMQWQSVGFFYNSVAKPPILPEQLREQMPLVKHPVQLEEITRNWISRLNFTTSQAQLLYADSLLGRAAGSIRQQVAWLDLWAFHLKYSLLEQLVEPYLDHTHYEYTHTSNPDQLLEEKKTLYAFANQLYKDLKPYQSAFLEAQPWLKAYAWLVLVMALFLCYKSFRGSVYILFGGMVLITFAVSLIWFMPFKLRFWGIYDGLVWLGGLYWIYQIRFNVSTRP